MAPQPKTIGDVVVVDSPGGKPPPDTDFEKLEATLRQLVSAGHKKLLVDLAHTSYMTSRSIGMLVGVQANAFKSGAALYLCNVDKRIHNVLVILWLTRVLNVLGSREEALDFLHALDLQLAEDTVRVRAARVERVNTTLAYMWTNNGAAAMIHQATPAGLGRAMLRMRDATGQEVFARALDERGDFPTTTGKPGAWRVEIDLTDYTGPLELGIEKL